MSANSRDKDKLKRYRAKRQATSTPEPFGSSQKEAGSNVGGLGRFVVHKHAARRLHYDFRLELDGVLVSWAVPKGPCLDPGEKRMAIHVEAHPLEYGDFEGRIPEGNYGAGAVIIWDRGQWVPIEDPRTGLRDGKLLFDLKGYKLRGRWTLVRTKRAGQTEPSKEWLLIKKTDAYADPDGEREVSEASVLSGMTVSEVRDGPTRAAKIASKIQSLGAPQRPVALESVTPMLCESRKRPFTDPDWIFELKYDGYRLLAQGEGGASALRYRSGRDATQWFPDIAPVIAALPYSDFLLDGEVAVLDDDGRPNFLRMQQRTKLASPRDIRWAALEHPVTYHVFDLLSFQGYDLRGLPLLTRRALLKEMLPSSGPLRYVDYIAERGEEFFDKVNEMGLEGVVAKQLGSRYVSERSPQWLKIRNEQVDDFAIVGFTASTDGARSLGAIHLAQWYQAEARWIYAGRAGTGFSHQEISELHAALSALPRWTPTFPDPDVRDTTWVEPQLVCTVRYASWRDDYLLRMPVFVRCRDDKKVNECLWSGWHGEEPPLVTVDQEEPEREIQYTNLTKVFWPEHGYTKGDLIDFYREIGPWFMPYLQDRPIVLTRYPDGIHGKSFFQKDAPKWVPEWIHTEVMWSEHAEREIHYFVCDDIPSLTYLANLGTIPIHMWSSQLASLSSPDWSVLDLDPKGAPFAHVVRCALAIRALCQDIALPCFVKSSGSTGLHILIPLGRQCTYQQSRHLAHLLAKVIETELPDIATTKRMMSAREGRVYLDFGQNGHGKLIVAPYSVRPRIGATVSAPLHWSEVNEDLCIDDFTIRTLLDRVQRHGDPLLEIFSAQSNLAHSLVLLGDRLKGA